MPTEIVYNGLPHTGRPTQAWADHPGHHPYGPLCCTKAGVAVQAQAHQDNAHDFEGCDTPCRPHLIPARGETHAYCVASHALPRVSTHPPTHSLEAPMPTHSLPGCVLLWAGFAHTHHTLCMAAQAPDVHPATNVTPTKEREHISMHGVAPAVVVLSGCGAGAHTALATMVRVNTQGWSVNTHCQSTPAHTIRAHALAHTHVSMHTHTHKHTHMVRHAKKRQRITPKWMEVSCWPS